MNYYVYILRSQSSARYYIGQTDNLSSRLDKHNKGYVKSTKRFIPWELMYYESFDSRKESFSREQQIKKWKSRSMIDKLIETKPSEI